MKRALSRKNLWNSTPAFLKAAMRVLVQPVPSAWLLGRRFRSECKHALESQWWSAERARDYQRQRVGEILRLAYDKTVFYRRAFDAVGLHPKEMKSLEDMRDLPTINKETVTQNLADMCTRDIDGIDIDSMSTGGTSGAPLHFYINADRSAVEYAYLTASWARIGYEIGMPMAVLRGRVVPRDRTGLYHEYDPILRHHYYSNFHANDTHMGRYLEHIHRIGPCMLHAYPSSAYAMAKYIAASGRSAPENIKGVLLESENVYTDQIEEIEGAFGTRTFASYGHSEKLVLAAQCEASTDYHVWPTYGFFELLDAEGRPVKKPGDEGEIVGTGFIDTVVPFIRYRTGDYATYAGECCSACGREHTIVRNIRGHRTHEMLAAADGTEISWTALNMHDDTFLHVRQFQFMQETPGRAVLRVVPAQGFAAQDKERIHRNLGRKLNGQLTFSIELVEAIALSPRGKAVYVDQRIPGR